MTYATKSDKKGAIKPYVALKPLIVFVWVRALDTLLTHVMEAVIIIYIAFFTPLSQTGSALCSHINSS